MNNNKRYNRPFQLEVNVARTMVILHYGYNITKNGARCLHKVCVINLLPAIFGDQRTKGLGRKGD